MTIVFFNSLCQSFIITLSDMKEFCKSFTTQQTLHLFLKLKEVNMNRRSSLLSYWIFHVTEHNSLYVY